MICKNCGAQLPDNSAFCGNCGAPVEQSSGLGGNITAPIPPMSDNGIQTDKNPEFNQNPNGFDPNSVSIDPNSGFNPNAPAVPNSGGLLENKKKVKTLAVSVVAVIIVAAIVVGTISVIGSNPDKTIDRFMTAFLAQDGEAMNAEVSESYKKAVVYALETIDYINDGAISKQAGKDLNEYVEELIADSLEDEAKYFLMDFEYELGSTYKTEYEITAEEKAEKDELKKFNEVVSRLSGKDFNTSGLMLADIKVSGKSGSDKCEEEFTIFLCKDGSKWKVLDIFEIGYDFDDLYGSLDIENFESYFK